MVKNLPANAGDVVQSLVQDKNTENIWDSFIAMVETIDTAQEFLQLECPGFLWFSSLPLESSPYLLLI